ncbi:hypothetical protein BH23ACT11_BH23ACT11_24800 [soil metagenome]
MRAAVAMVDESGSGVSAPQGHLKSVRDQFGPEMVRHCPANYAAAASVEDEGQVEESLMTGRQIRYVRQPQAVGTGGEKAAVDQVGSGRRTIVAAGSRSPFTPHAAVQAIFAHQASHPPPSALNSQGVQLGVYAWVAVCPAGTLMDLPDLFREGAVLHRAPRLRPVQPGVVA